MLLGRLRPAPLRIASSRIRRLLSANSLREDADQPASQALSEQKASQEAKHEKTTPLATIEDFDRCKIQVSKINTVSKHPDADSLYVCNIQSSDDESLTLVTGLVPYYSEQELRDRFIVTIMNLKPTKLRGILSQAMLLAATNTENKKAVLLDVPNGSVVGDRIGLKDTPAKVDAAKQVNGKLWERVTASLSVSGGAAHFQGYTLATQHGPITAKDCPDGSPIH